MLASAPFISKYYTYYTNYVAVSCPAICTVLWLRSCQLSIILLIILSLDCFDTHELLWHTTAFKLLAAFSSTGTAFHLEPRHGVHINQRALLSLAKAPFAITLYSAI
jgi:hypothetical protein